jgi:hypothetical protein
MRSRVLACALAVVAQSGCATSSAPHPLPDLGGQTVLAVVERLELNGYEVRGASGGETRAFNRVWLGVYKPQPLPLMIPVHVAGPPQLDGRPLQMGDRLQFVLPHDYRTRDLALDDLEGSQLVHPGPMAEEPVARSRGDRPRERIVAVVHRLEYQAHVDDLSDGSLYVTNLIGFGVLSPERRDALLFANVKGHPRVDGRPLQLGDVVTFLAPLNWRQESDFGLGDFEELSIQHPTGK